MKMPWETMTMEAHRHHMAIICFIHPLRPYIYMLLFLQVLVHVKGREGRRFVFFLNLIKDLFHQDNV